MIFDDELDESQKVVGKPLAMYTAPVWRIRVGIAAMLLVGIFAILGFLSAERRPGGEDLLVFLIFGVGSFAIAAGILLHHLRSRHHRIFICVEGLAIDHPPTLKCYRWTEIVKILEEREADVVHVLPIGTTYRAAVIEFVDGHRLFVDRNRISRVGELIDTIQRSVWSDRNQALIGPRDADLSGVVAAWPTLTEGDRARILSVLNWSDPASGS